VFAVVVRRAAFTPNCASHPATVRPHDALAPRVHTDGRDITTPITRLTEVTMYEPEATELDALETDAFEDTQGESFEDAFEEESMEELADTGETESETGLDEVDEMDLAAELLGVSDEAELDQFFGKLFKKVGKFLKSPVGKALGGILKKVAKKALPIAGSAIGGFFGGPAGAAIGGKLLPAAGQMFGLEVEGLSGEDAQFEVARNVVRFAGAAAKTAARAPAGANPAAVATAAAKKAAQRFAPGLLHRRGFADGGYGRTGRWYRRGRRIIVLGA
jgi:hypothetical protein